MSTMLAHAAFNSPALPQQSWGGARWVLRPPDPRTALAIAQQGLPQAAANILSARGVGVEDAPQFLHPKLRDCLPDPFVLHDMDKAADRISRAIMQREVLGILGDYDVDGATSSALLMRFFAALGVRALVYIPDRIREGYGPNDAAMQHFHTHGAHVAITVDCGTLAFGPLQTARQLGLDMIVLDHHLSEAALPPAHAVVNPNRLDETGEPGGKYGNLAAVGVTFLTCIAVIKRLRAAGWFVSSGVAEPDLLQWLDLVALGTVCDMVKLDLLNRAFVSQGLKILAARRNVGLRALMDRAGLQEAPGAYHLGFTLGPRINAGGRVGACDAGANLLACDDPMKAADLAEQMQRWNAERQAIEVLVLEQAIAQAQSQANMPLLLVHGQGWHQGVIGVVAGRLKEMFYKPVAVIAVENNIGKASARSVEGFDWGATVIRARQEGKLIAGGGHAMAAGFTIDASTIESFHHWLCERFEAASADIATQRSWKIDAQVALSALTPALAESLEAMAPFGIGNPQPKLHLSQVIVQHAAWVKDQHLRLTLLDPFQHTRHNAICFRCHNTPLGNGLSSSVGKSVQLVVELRHQLWNGKARAEIHILDAAPCLS